MIHLQQMVEVLQDLHEDHQNIIQVESDHIVQAIHHIIADLVHDHHSHHHHVEKVIDIIEQVTIENHLHQQNVEIIEK
jgi:hypothetical protein